jgi:hypothetical protein
MIVLRVAVVGLAAWFSTAIAAAPAFGSGWKAGTGRAVITPERSMWMAGYGARNHPSEGAVHDLWAKALVLEDPSGQKALLVTLDVCGIDRETSRQVRDAVQKGHGLPYERIVLACSHTHCGPVVGSNLISMYPLDDDQRSRVAAYTAELREKVRQAVDQAFGRLQPVDLAWETGRADFAVNRRNNKEPEVPALRARNALEGPVDHDVPVLRARGADGRLKAIVFGYACHCTVMSFYKFCGDYAGFAQLALERSEPDAQAMFVADCGADQNPLPRRTLELAEAYGNQLAESVRRVLAEPMRPVEGELRASYEEFPLKLGTLPTRAQIEADARSTTFAVAGRARRLLQTLDAEGKLPETYPYPLQVWRAGGLTWIFLGGEVVVDYSLRLKRNLGSSKTWVSAYCNDVMAYIPSARVLKEGGYEGATSMVAYGLPTTWSEDVERQIIDALNGLLDRTAPPR